MQTIFYLVERVPTGEELGGVPVTFVRFWDGLDFIFDESQAAQFKQAPPQVERLKAVMRATNTPGSVIKVESVLC